jgi:hypothetical protein
MGFQITPTIIQPSIECCGLTISEPMIALTDLLVFAVSIYAWQRLKKSKNSIESKPFFMYFILFTGLSALLGAIFGHAFMPMFGFGGKLPSWILSMIGVGCLAQGSLLHCKRLYDEATLRGLIGSVWIMFGVFVVAALVALKFLYAEFYMAYTYLLILGISEFRMLRKYKNRSSHLLLLSLGFVIAAAIAHASKFSLGIWFTYFDIGHVLVCGSVWYVMLAVDEISNESTIKA